MYYYYLYKSLNRVKWKIERFFCKKFCVSYLYKKNSYFDPKSIRFDGMPYLRIADSATVHIGHSVRIVSTKFLGIDSSVFTKISVAKNSYLIIGNYTGMTNSIIYSDVGVEIGHHVNIGAGTMIIDSDFHSLDWHDRHDRTDYQNRVSKPIKIGDYVFIGTRSIILKGVKIGDKAIIAAGSVVSCDIPEGEMWGGNPARYIKNVPNFV